jgi:succinate dehydrogenase / fumarate reductase flavoprotein subunit
LEALKKEKIAVDENGIAFALETENLACVAEMVLRACLMRKESRGPHLFFGHFDDPQPLPSRDPKWRKYIVIRNRTGKMVLQKREPVKLEV